MTYGEDVRRRRAESRRLRRRTVRGRNAPRIRRSVGKMGSKRRISADPSGWQAIRRGVTRSHGVPTHRRARPARRPHRAPTASSRHPQSPSGLKSPQSRLRSPVADSGHRHPRAHRFHARRSSRRRTRQPTPSPLGPPATPAGIPSPASPQPEALKATSRPRLLSRGLAQALGERQGPSDGQVVAPVAEFEHRSAALRRRMRTDPRELQFIRVVG